MTNRFVARRSTAQSSVRLSLIAGALIASSTIPAFAQNGTSTQAIVPPVNLRVKGIWTTGPTDTLSWDAVPGAAYYNLYQYDRMIGSNIKSTTFTVPNKLYVVATLYTVTAVDKNGVESIYSYPVRALGRVNPSTQPSWLPPAPTMPVKVTATAQWNNGVPQVYLEWQGRQNTKTFNIYRNNTLIASGLWNLYYIDTKVAPGAKYTYSIQAENIRWKTIQQSARTPAITFTVPQKAPSNPVGVLSQVSVDPNDDSVVLSFPPVPGAVDYRAYNVAKPNSYKYSGGGLNIEMNGLDPKTTSQFVVEALDKFGPYQKMDGFNMPPAPGVQHVNGQGDPSNVPTVLARSAPISAKCIERKLTGKNAFFDNFRNSKPFAPIAVPPILEKLYPKQVAAVANDKWTIYNIQGDLIMSNIFVMSNHFMETLYDGGTVGSANPLHVSNASLIMSPKAVADISGGKVLHVTFEVDAHYNPRRWCQLFVGEAGDQFRRSAKFISSNERPTEKGNVFLWSVEKEFHNAILVRTINNNMSVDKLLNLDWATGATDRNGPANRLKYNYNGTTKDIDLRNQFDLYLSTTRVVGLENGNVVFDRKFPNGIKLPFNRCAVYFVHEVYHTDNDRCENIESTDGKEKYWYNYRPYADERHWDNMGFEVLDRFP